MNNYKLLQVSVLFFVSFFFFTLDTKAQDSIPAFKLYKVEFDVKGDQKVDLDILAKINIVNYLPLRQLSTNVEVLDPVSGKILIIYSQEELKIVREPYYNSSNMLNDSNSKKQ